MGGTNRFGCVPAIECLALSGGGGSSLRNNGVINQVWAARARRAASVGSVGTQTSATPALRPALNKHNKDIQKHRHLIKTFKPFSVTLNLLKQNINVQYQIIQFTGCKATSRSINRGL